MRSFWKVFFAVILAMIVSATIFIFIVLGIVGAVSSLSKQTVEVKDNSILVVTLDNEIVDRKVVNPFEEIEFMGFSSSSVTGLNQIISCIKKAKIDDRIKGIYLNLSGIRAGYATVEEIRSALSDFKSSGKFIYSYSDAISQKAYYLATISDSLMLNPHGLFDFRGLNAERMFFKKAMEKFGVEMQVVRGKNNKFKSAVEPFMLEKMSEASRKQTSFFLNSIWEHLLEGISEERNISVEKLKEYADEVLTFRKADVAKEYGLFDNLKYKDQVISDLRGLTGVRKSDDLEEISISKYYKAPCQYDKSVLKKDEIAVIYAQGDIDMGGKGAYAIDSDKISRSIREVRADSTVKAIVLRVNSQGGSAFGSEVVLREITLSAKDKPTIVSFGDYATSGGYYLACGADKILSQPTTLTGSIGIFGMIPNFGTLLNEKIGVTFDNVTTNKHSDMPSVHRRMTPFEKNLVQSYIENGYQLFLERVAEGRGTTPEKIDEIGQGRVWSGINGKDLGLVDEFGGISDAITLAAEMAGLEEYYVKELPEEKCPFGEILQNLTGSVQSRIMKIRLGEAYDYWESLSFYTTSWGIFARMPYSIEIN